MTAAGSLCQGWALAQLVGNCAELPSPNAGDRCFALPVVDNWLCLCLDRDGLPDLASLVQAVTWLMEQQMAYVYCDVGPNVLTVHLQ